MYTCQIKSNLSLVFVTHMIGQDKFSCTVCTVAMYMYVHTHVRSCMVCINSYGLYVYFNYYIYILYTQIKVQM